MKTVCLSTGLVAALVAAPLLADEPAKSREFSFRYEAIVTGLKPGQTARVWLPVPPSNEDQEVMVGELPAGGKIGTEAKYGNKILYMELTAGADGKAAIGVSYKVKRKEVSATPAAMEAMEREMYLKPDAMVPVGGKTQALIEGKTLPDDPMKAARTLYDVVNNHMRYSKEGTGWGRGDAEWACDSKFGNCSDFHSLFISLARAQKIPAKFEIGFPLPAKHGKGEIPGYHCWAKFLVAGHGWVPVDISEANKDPKMAEYFFGHLTPDRVAFSTGRDLTLVPKQDGRPLNFFVYPYVEVGGKPWEKVLKRFSFADAE